MKLTLFVKLSLEASHSLEEKEAPHPHLWEISVGLEGPVVQGRIVSLPLIHKMYSDVLRPFQGTFLNENQQLDAASREIPTCENLSYFLWEKFSAQMRTLPETSWIKIVSMDIGVNEPDGTQLGFARLTE